VSNPTGRQNALDHIWQRISRNVHSRNRLVVVTVKRQSDEPLAANLVRGGSDPMRKVRPVRHRLDDLSHQSLPAVSRLRPAWFRQKRVGGIVGICKLRGPRSVLPASCTRSVGVSGPRQPVLSLIVDSVHNWTQTT
jgi:hypothetical protein